MPVRNFIRICVTGGLACGKSEVGALLARAGVSVREADDVCFELMQPDGRLHQRIVSAFGRNILDGHGGIDRGLLGKRVFSDAKQRRRLNDLVHPEAKREILCWLKEQEKKRKRGKCNSFPGLAVIVPLAYEMNWLDLWDCVVCVAVPEPLQLLRLQNRGLSARDALARIRTQLPVEEKMRRADYVIFNAGSREELRRQTRTVLADITVKIKQKQRGEK